VILVSTGRIAREMVGESFSFRLGSLYRTDISITYPARGRPWTASSNEGTVDRVLRVTAGLVLLSLVFVGPQTLWGLVGLVPLATGLLGSCSASARTR
jgi:hypothetical protein